VLDIDEVFGAVDEVLADTSLSIPSQLTTIQNIAGSTWSETELTTSKVNTVLSKLDTQTTSITGYGEVVEVLFPKTAGTVSVDGNEEEEVGSYTTSSTSYVKLFSKEVGANIAGKTISSVYIDLGWSGQTDTGTGSTVWAVNTTDSWSGAVDLTDELSEGTVKTGHWRSGQVKLASMDTASFFVLLGGKATTGTLTARGYAGASVTVIYEV
jgi:hypothetical protein